MTRMDLHPAAARTPNPTPDDEQLLASARRALAIEARAVEALTARLGAAFAQACRVCLDCHGRVVVTGMGKSGHVAGKIAATLASTGTPAFFLHPAEAGHGDLGMITRVDAVLALSNSGETPELVLLLPHLKRLAVPLIVMTGKTDSTLGRAANGTPDVGVPEGASPRAPHRDARQDRSDARARRERDARCRRARGSLPAESRAHRQHHGHAR